MFMILRRVAQLPEEREIITDVPPPPKFDSNDQP
jgi:hypothetical protein